MRIISGELKGRKIDLPKAHKVRPTTDRAKEALFNVLSNQFEFSILSVLDLFTGSGSIGLEFYSRGAKNVTAVENNHNVYNHLKRSIDSWKLNNYNLIKSDVEQYIDRCKDRYDVIFLDPPYNMVNKEKLIDKLYSHNLVSGNGIIILEHSVTESFIEQPKFKQNRVYSSSVFSFFYEG